MNAVQICWQLCLHAVADQTVTAQHWPEGMSNKIVQGSTMVLHVHFVDAAGS